MNAERIAIANSCLQAAHDGSLSFPEIMNELVDAGFEGYSVDYRRNAQIYFLPDGDNVEIIMPHSAENVAAVFDSESVEALVHWAQNNPSDYSYVAFSNKVTAAGCAGYIVSFLGRRIVYYGRTAETHIELFPL